MDQSSIPSEQEVLEVTALTTAYLQFYFMELFDDLSSLTVEYVDNRFEIGAPFEIDYTSTASFEKGSANIPGTGGLDLALQEAFVGDNLVSYLNLLDSQLPEDNIFRTTTDVTMESQSFSSTQAPVPVQDSTNTTARGGWAAIGASAGALLVAGIAFGVYKQRGGGYDKMETEEKEAVVTLAGETYLGASTMCSATVKKTRFADEVAQSESALLNPSESDDQNGTMSFVDPLAALPEDESHQTEDSPSSVEVLDDGVSVLSEDSFVPMRVVDLIKKFSSSSIR
jgi:hypothetical protein